MAQTLPVTVHDPKLSPVTDSLNDFARHCTERSANHD